MGEFNRGDLVFCIDDTATQGLLVYGQIYEIDDPHSSNYSLGTNEYYLKNEPRLSWKESRFELYQRLNSEPDLKSELELHKAEIAKLEKKLKEAESLLRASFDTTEDANLVRLIYRYLDGEEL